jgi:hypothetical protein
LDERLSLLFVVPVGVEQAVGGEQQHHQLLGLGQPGGVVEGDAAGVGDQSVDEADFPRGEGERGVPRIEGALVVLGQPLQEPVEDVVGVDPDDAEPPPGGAEVLGERVDQHGIAGYVGGERGEAVDEGAVDVVGDHHQVGIVVNHVGDPPERRGFDGHRRRVGGVDADQYLHRGVAQLVDVGVQVLPGVAAVGGAGFGAQVQQVEAVVLELGDLQVRGEDRRHHRDPVTFAEQPVHHQRVQHLADRGGAALDGEQVHRADPGAHLLQQIPPDNVVHVVQHPVRVGVVAADHRVRELPHEGIRVVAALVDPPVQDLAEQVDPPVVGLTSEPVPEPFGDAVLLRDTDQLRVPGHRVPAFLQGEQAEPEERLPRGGGREVRVPAAGVELLERGAALVLAGDLAELLLQLERRQGLQCADVAAAQGLIGLAAGLPGLVTRACPSGAGRHGIQWRRPSAATGLIVRRDARSRGIDVARVMR